MTTDALIALILQEEGGFVNDPADHGGATAYGITAASWGRYQRLGREATVAELQRLTPADADGYYRAQITLSPFRAPVVPYEPLRVQLFDFGVHSGTARAIRWLQRVLHVPMNDGTLDDRTQVALVAAPGRLVNNALVAARCVMFHEIVAADATQRVFMNGWLTRAVAFAELDPVPTVTPMEPTV